MKKNVKYIIISIIALISVFHITKSHNEKVVGRMDISTKLVDVNNPQFEVYTGSSNSPEKQADWMTKLNKQGYVVQDNDNDMEANIKVSRDTHIDISLMGKYQLDTANHIVENWVEYKSLKINGKEVLTKPVAVWHNKPFVYTLDAKSGQEYKVYATWQKHKTN